MRVSKSVVVDSFTTSLATYSETANKKPKDTFHKELGTISEVIFNTLEDKNSEKLDLSISYMGDVYELPDEPMFDGPVGLVLCKVNSKTNERVEIKPDTKLPKCLSLVIVGLTCKRDEYITIRTEGRLINSVIEVYKH